MKIQKLSKLILSSLVIVIMNNFCVSDGNDLEIEQNSSEAIIPLSEIVVMAKNVNSKQFRNSMNDFEVKKSKIVQIESNEEFYNFIKKNITYPAIAKENGIEGKVFVQFIVDDDGRLIDVKAVKGIGAGCDEEAVRVIESSPKWKSGTQKDQTVNVRMIIPITFKLD